MSQILIINRVLQTLLTYQVENCEHNQKTKRGKKSYGADQNSGQKKKLQKLVGCTFKSVLHWLVDLLQILEIKRYADTTEKIALNTRCILRSSNLLCSNIKLTVYDKYMKDPGSFILSKAQL